MRSYSKAFYNELTQRLTKYSKSNTVERPNYNILVDKVNNGVKLDLDRLDKNLIEVLFIQELCTDAMVAQLYGIDTSIVNKLRLLYNITDDVIKMGHPLWITKQLSAELVEELGEKAYMM